MTDKACFPVTRILREGMFANVPCFVVGGGSSLAGFPFERLPARGIVVAVNKAWKCGVADIVVGTDRHFWTDSAAGLTHLVQNAQAERFLKCGRGPQTGSWGVDRILPNPPKTLHPCAANVGHEPLLVFSHGAEQWPLDVEGYRLVTDRNDVWGHNFDEGVVASADTGLRAVNLADILGCNPVYLLGFDMHSKDPQGVRQSWWHEGYSQVKRADVYDRMIPWYQRAVASGCIKASVVNLGPDSRLECFPKEDWRSVL